MSETLSWNERLSLWGARAFGHCISEAFWHAHRVALLPSSARVSLLRDVPYGPHERQRLDIYLPATPGLTTPQGISSPGAGSPSHTRVPFLFFVHGGGWMMCSRRMAAAVGRTLAARGIAVVAPGYRLIPHVALDEQVGDLSLAFKKIEVLSRQLPLDMRSYAVGGESAGAHLAARLMQDSSTAPPQARGFVGIYGLYDLRNYGEHSPAGYGMMLAALRRGRPFDAWAREHSALRPLWNRQLPVLLLHGDADGLVAADQSYAMATCLRRGGADVDLRIHKGAGHGFIYNGVPTRRAQAGQAYGQLVRFLRKRVFSTGAGVK